MLNSEGNEIFFSYDGNWKDGRLHGRGKYLYEDGMFSADTGLVVGR